MIDKIFRLNHDCFRLEGEVMVYTDPFHIDDGLPPADLILISHEHFDHCSVEDIEKLAGQGTVVVTVEACCEQLMDLDVELVIVAPGDKVEVKGVAVEAVPAYNTNKDFHPKAAGHVGFIVTLGGKRIYFAGDTDRIPEMKELQVDIALLPVSGTYVMTAAEAVEAARDLNPEVAVPMHYDDIVGTANDAQAFADGYDGKVVIK